MFVFDSSSCKLILEEHILQNPHEVEGENEMNECRKLQVNNVLMQKEINSREPMVTSGQRGCNGGYLVAKVSKTGLLANTRVSQIFFIRLPS